LETLTETMSKCVDEPVLKSTCTSLVTFLY
jgi:hypothetical protein